MICKKQNGNVLSLSSNSMLDTETTTIQRQTLNDISEMTFLQDKFLALEEPLFEDSQDSIIPSHHIFQVERDAPVLSFKKKYDLKLSGLWLD